MAAADIFLTIKGPDISGESLDKVHSGMIECLSWHWGATNLGTASTGGGAGAGAVVKHDLTITKYVDCVRQHGYNLPAPNFSGIANDSSPPTRPL